MGASTREGTHGPVMELDQVTRRYRMGDQIVRALDGVSLTIERGQFTSIMGTSGSGKSTLMNIMGLLDRPSSGTYRLVGRDVSTLSPSRRARVRNRELGFVFQSFNLLARTSALDNVSLPLIYAGVGARERRERAAEALRSVGLGERMDHRPNQLSGGQQQRVAIARAIVSRPAVILADEPTGALDSRTTEEVLALFRDLADRGMTVILVTHEAEVAAWTSRVLWMRDGRLIADQAHTPGEPVAAPPVPTAEDDP